MSGKQRRLDREKRERHRHDRYATAHRVRMKDLFLCVCKLRYVKEEGTFCSECEKALKEIK